MLLLLQACASPDGPNDPCDGTTAEDHYKCGFDAYFERHDAATAICEYTEAIKLKPDYVEALGNRADLYRHDGDTAAAIRDLTTAIRLEPRSVLAYNNRANAYSDMGDTDSALEDLGAALAIDPTFADAYYGRGNIRYGQCRFPEAVADVTEAIHYYAKGANGPSQEVKSWFDAGRYDAPSMENPNIRVIDQYLADSYYLRSIAYSRLDDTARSEEDLREARRIDVTIDLRAPL
jgi:tetratricopeptide (TPR) repeat protein